MQTSVGEIAIKLLIRVHVIGCIPFTNLSMVREIVEVCAPVVPLNLKRLFHKQDIIAAIMQKQFVFDMLINLFIGLSHYYLDQIRQLTAGARQGLTDHSVHTRCLYGGLRSLANHLLEDVDGRACTCRPSPSRALRDNHSA